MISLTASGQTCSIHNEDCVHITREQQKQCIKWFKELQLKDSVIVAKDSIIRIQSGFIASSEELILEIDADLAESRADLKKMKKKRNRAFIFGGISTILATLVTILVIST